MSRKQPRRGATKLVRGRRVPRTKIIADKKVVYVEMIVKSSKGVQYTRYVPMLVSNK